MILHQIKEMMEDELAKLSKKPELSHADLECIDKMVDIVKDISTINAMEDAGYSTERFRYEEPDRYYADHSYRRGRDAMGKYTSRDDHPDYGYSGHNQMSMIEELEILYRASTNEAERENICKVIDQLKR